MVTKVVEGEKFEFQFVLYNPNKSVAATDDDKDLEKNDGENLGQVFVGSSFAAIEIRMNPSGDVRVYSAYPANILLLN